jgi:hypothetical protein
MKNQSEFKKDLAHKKFVESGSLQRKADELLTAWLEVREDLRGKRAVKAEA